MNYQQQFLSDPLSPVAQQRWQQWHEVVGQAGWKPSEASSLAGDETWTLVVDPTGGSQAIGRLNSLLSVVATAPSPHSQSRAWWSMSDNCVALNALLDRRFCRLIHGHPLVLVGRDATSQWIRTRQWTRAIEQGREFPSDCVPPLAPLKGTWPSSAALVGGNLGAWERLGTTPWRPNPAGRVLLLESLSATTSDLPQRLGIVVREAELSGARGVVFGRFSHADREDPSWLERWIDGTKFDLPMARCLEIGHGSDAWSVPLGELIAFRWRG